VGAVLLVDRNTNVSLAELVLARVHPKFICEELAAVAVCALGLGIAVIVTVRFETGVP
jgi:hypothetical protein